MRRNCGLPCAGRLRLLDGGRSTKGDIISRIDEITAKALLDFKRV